MQESSQQRKTRLIYEKAARAAARWDQSKRSHPRHISGQQKLERLKRQLIEEQNNRLRERIDFYDQLSLDRTPPITRIIFKVSSYSTQFCFSRHGKCQQL